MVESVNTSCDPLSASHMHLQWHNKDAASRDLWMKTYAGAYSVVNRWDRQPRSWKVTSKHHPHTSVNHYLLVNCSQLWLSSSQSLGFSSSFITRIPSFGFYTTVDIDGLPILRQSIGLLWCPPFGVTSGLLWKDVRFWMSRHLNVTRWTESEWAKMANWALSHWSTAYKWKDK